MNRTFLSIATLALAPLWLAPTSHAREYVYFNSVVGLTDSPDDIGVYDADTGSLDSPLSSISFGGDFELDPNGDLMWISQPGEIQAVNIRNGQVEKTIAGPNSPANIEISPDGDVLYVLFPGFDLIRSYRTSDGTQLAQGTIPASEFPVLAVAGDGDTIYWVSRSLADVHALDATTLVETTVFPVPNGGDTISLSADGSTIAVPDETFFRMTVVDVDSGSVSDLTLPRPPRDLVLNADGTIAYVATGTNVDLIDTATGALLGIVDAPANDGIRLSADESRLYFSGIDSLVQADLTTLEVLDEQRIPGFTQKILVGDTPRDATGMSRGFRASASTCENTANGASTQIQQPLQQWTCPLAELDAATGDTIRVTLTGTRNVDRYAYAPSSFDNGLYVVSLGSAQAVDRVPADAAPTSVAIHPDARTVFVAANQAGEVRIYDTFSNAQIGSFTPPGTNPTNVEFTLAFEPNGSRLWVADERANRITVVDADTLAVITQIPVNEAGATTFDPSGAKAYVGRGFVGGAFTEVDVASYTVTRVINLPQPIPVMDMAVDADGERLFLAASIESLLVFDLTQGLLTSTIPLTGGAAAVNTSTNGNVLHIGDSATLSYAAATPPTPVVFDTAPTSLPTDITQDPITGLVYVTNAGGNTLRRYAPATGAELAPITVGNLTARGDLLASAPIVTQIAGLVDSAIGLTEYRCTNLTTQQTVTTMVSEGTKRWNCTRLGLAASVGDAVEVELLISSD